MLHVPVNPTALMDIGADPWLTYKNSFSSPNRGFALGRWGVISENNLCISYRNTCAYNFIQKILYICIALFFLLQVVVLGEKF